jgi:hypothetical protein
MPASVRKTWAGRLVPAVAPGTFPAAWAPSRLGTDLLFGETWQSVVWQGTADNGFTNLQALGGRGFALGSSAFPATPSMLRMVADPMFSQAVQITNLAGSNGCCAQTHIRFPTTKTVWWRWTQRFSPGYTAATQTVGESGTQKLGFLWDRRNITLGTPRQRLSFVLMSSGEIQVEGGASGGTTTNLVSTNANTPAPVPSVLFQGFYASKVPTLGGPYPAQSMLQTGDWYTFTINVSTDLATGEVLRRWFIQRVSGAPWAYPMWKGTRTLGGSIDEFDEVWIEGNKSGAATNEQYTYLGPTEVSSARNPYGWDGYGR